VSTRTPPWTWSSSPWQLAAERYNFLRGEAFSLGGEFLPRTADSFDGLFLEAANEQCLQSTLRQFNEKQESFANRGAIFMGPPGTGKTLSGRVLRNQAAGTFVWISARDFRYAGAFGGISYAFELAKELAPCVLFLEDVDNWLDSYAIDLLKTEMDGIGRYKGVWTVLTTNFPEELPEALIDRPGRFHDVLNFALPTEAVRTKMVKAWLPGLGGDALKKAVAGTDGYSGAHVFELCHFARTLQEQEPTKSLDGALDEALAKVRQQKEMVAALNPSPRRRYQKSFAAPLELDGPTLAYRARSKGIIPYARHPRAPEDAAWDGPAEKAQADVAALKQMCAWYADDGASKGDYQLPHHTAKGCQTVWAGVRAAMAALLGARGGTAIPDSDQKGVYRHLASHYQEFGKEPPEFGKSYTPDERKALFPDTPMTDDPIAKDAPPLDDLVPPPADGAKKPTKDENESAPDVTLADLHKVLAEISAKLDAFAPKKDEDEDEGVTCSKDEEEEDDEEEEESVHKDEEEEEDDEDDDDDDDDDEDDDEGDDDDAPPPNRKPVVKRKPKKGKKALTPADKVALKKTLKALAKLQKNQDKLNEQFFGLTGRKL
jgi:SpoVK/Ycf46/Vps4 family AAA+-type ATPase